MAKYEYTNLALTVNSYGTADRVLKMNHHAFNIINRRLYGRRHKRIQYIGNIEGNTNRHLHLTVTLPTKHLTTFKALYTQHMARLLPSIGSQLSAIAIKRTQGLPITSYPIVFNNIPTDQDLGRWLNYCNKRSSQQLDNSFVG